MKIFEKVSKKSSLELSQKSFFSKIAVEAVLVRCSRTFIIQYCKPKSLYCILQENTAWCFHEKYWILQSLLQTISAIFRSKFFVRFDQTLKDSQFKSLTNFFGSFITYFCYFSKRVYSIHLFFAKRDHAEEKIHLFSRIPIDTLLTLSSASYTITR